MTPKSHLYIVLSTEKDGNPIELMDVYGGLGQLDDVFNDPKNHSLAAFISADIPFYN